MPADLATVVAAIAALKPTFDALRSAMGLLKDAKELLRWRSEGSSNFASAGYC
jgi:hypothetical protein